MTLDQEAMVEEALVGIARYRASPRMYFLRLKSDRSTHEASQATRDANVPMLEIDVAHPSLFKRFQMANRGIE